MAHEIDHYLSALVFGVSHAHHEGPGEESADDAQDDVYSEMEAGNASDDVSDAEVEWILKYGDYDPTETVDLPYH